MSPCIRPTVPLDAVGCPIRRSADHRALAPPRGLSQRATSFLASRRQGIHPMPSLRSPRPGPGTLAAPNAGTPEHTPPTVDRHRTSRSDRTARRRPHPARRPEATSPTTLFTMSNRPPTTTARTPHDAARLVGPGRIERPTSPLSGVRSDRLSYGPGSHPTAARTAAIEENR